MKLGKRTQELMKIYGLLPEDVTFARLLATDCTQMEAYCIAFHDKLTQIGAGASSPLTAAHELVKNKPAILSLARSFKTTVDPDRAKEEGKERKRKGGKTTNIATKEAQLRELQQIYSNLNTPKDRLDVLKQVADLQQLKKDETKAEERRTFYYLPLKCKICPFAPAKQEKP